MATDVTRHVTVERYDVCVVGGGLAGTCAALAAARGGARTALVTDRPVLGGNSSSELRIPPAGSGYYNPWATETGIVHELIVEDRARNHDPVQYGHANGVWDLVLYDACRREPGLTLYLNTNVHQVAMADQHTVGEVVGVQAGSGTTLHVPARLFIDASGDGVVGVGAGVPWRTGAESRAEYGEPLAPEQPDDFVMGSTLTFRARDFGREAPFAPPDWAQVYDYPDGIPHRSTASFAGGYWWIEVGWPLDPLDQQDAIRDELLRHVYGIWDHIKNRGREREAARTWVLDWVGYLPAKRESRRFVGAHVLTEHEVRAGATFPDTVAYGGWSIDDHTRGGILNLEQSPSFHDVPIISYFVRPYAVPLRCLYAEPVTNLLFCGRVLSASRIAFSSLRVQQTLATTGQATGTAAALCVARDVAPAALAAAPEALQQRLLRDDAWLPGVAHEHLGRDLGGVTATASSVAACATEPGDGGIDLSGAPAALVPISGDRLDAVRLHLTNDGPAAAAVVTLHPADGVTDLYALDRASAASVEVVVPTGGGVVEARLNAVVEPGRMVWIKVAGPAGPRWRYAVDDPIGTCSAYRRPDGYLWYGPGTWARWRSLAVDVLPESRPYGPEQVLTGLDRPAATTNAWVSDPAQPLPQWIELELPDPPQVIDTVQLLFDTQLNRINYVTPGLFRAPECVRDYTLTAEVAGEWLELASVTGNYHRRREHGFPPMAPSRLRLTVTATNGDASARVYAVRLYRDS